MKTISIAVISGRDYKSAIGDLIFGGPTDLPAQRIRDIYERICAALFSSYNLGCLPNLIADCNYAFRRDELESILRSVHGVAFSLIFKTFREERMLPQAEAAPPELESADPTIDALKKVLSKSRRFPADRVPARGV